MLPASCARSVDTLPAEPLQEDHEDRPVAKLLASVGNNKISRMTANKSTLYRDRTNAESSGETAIQESPSTIPGTASSTGLTPADLLALVKAMTPEDRAAFVQALRGE